MKRRNIIKRLSKKGLALFALSSHVIGNLLLVALGYVRISYFLVLRKRKVVIISLLGNMGDLVACEPVSRWAKKNYPGYLIVWCVKARFRQLIDNNPIIDKTLILRCLTGWVLLKKIVKSSVIIDLNLNGLSCEVCGIPNKKKSNIDINNYFNNGCLLEAFSAGAGLPKLRNAPIVYCSKTVENRINSLGLPETFAVIHSYSASDYRNWDKLKWGQLLLWLFSEYKAMAVVEIGNEQMMSCSSRMYFNFCGRLDILGTAELIKRSKLFIGIDSGPAHLAHALRKKSVILIGKYRNFIDYTPYSKSGSGNMNIVRSREAASEIKTAQVMSAVKKVMK